MCDVGWEVWWRRGNLGDLCGLGWSFPATFRISYSIYAGVLSSQILFSCIRPYFLGFVRIIMSPLSYTCNLNRVADRYTSCLFEYSTFDIDMLQRMLPLCFLMPSYSCLLLDFDGQLITSLISLGGALTRVHPVVREKSCPRWVDSASFHYSRSPVYLLFWMSLVMLLYRYSQHARSGSTDFGCVLFLAGFHMSLVGYGTGYVVAGFSICCVFSCCVGLVSAEKRTCFLASMTCIAAFFASAGVLRMIMRSKMSSSVSGASSLGCSLVFDLVVVQWGFIEASFERVS